MKFRPGYKFLFAAMALMMGGCSSDKFASPGPSVSVAEGQHREATSESSKSPGFSVNVSLSEKAKKTLVQNKETVVVAGYATGFPKPGTPKRYVSGMGEIALGQVRAEVPPGHNVNFNGIQLRRDAINQIDSHGPQLLINVFSGRKSSKDNLLDCTIYDGPLRAIQGRSIPISCKLISE